MTCAMGSGTMGPFKTLIAPQWRELIGQTRMREYGPDSRAGESDHGLLSFG